MDPIKELCREMARDPDILTFSEIARAAAKGAVAAQETGLPGGALAGAVLGVSVEATKRVVVITQKLHHKAGS